MAELKNGDLSVISLMDLHCKITGFLPGVVEVSENPIFTVLKLFFYCSTKEENDDIQYLGFSVYI